MSEKELVRMLRAIRDDRDFILGVTLCLSNDDERQELADAIHRGTVKNEGDIVEYAWAIYNDAPFEDEEEEE